MVQVACWRACGRCVVAGTKALQSRAALVAAKSCQLTWDFKAKAAQGDGVCSDGSM